MKTKVKKEAAMLGGRIGFTLLIVSAFLVFAAYFVLSQNFQKLLSSYTIKLVQAMAALGVTTIEYELQAGQEEVSLIAASFSVPDKEEESLVFPAVFSRPDVLRLVYVSEEGSVSSDGRQRDLRGRRDIVEAYAGKTAVYGPYFNEEKEYVVCYSAPVLQDGEIAGVLSIEKDGYYFCELIRDIQFANTGEAYIINAEGTDIAVSNQEHIEWVNEQYNAERIWKEKKEGFVRSVMELESRGLVGETGVGTYYWENSLCYVVYNPVPSVGWVLLAGLREEEINSMTQSVLYASLTKGPALRISILVFFLLTAVIIFWIVSSMKKSAEMNERLNVLASYDSLTGVQNRNSYHTALERLAEERYRSLACVYIDANGLHEINNHLGHQAGDKMLETVADALRQMFSKTDIFRIGGDEFVVFGRNLDRQEIAHRMELVKQELKRKSYEISVGIEWRETEMDIKTMVNAAEAAMQQDKQQYYQENGKERQMRILDQKLERMVLEKQDADAFLSVLAPEFKGVYFVDLGLDTIRHLYIPPYFEKMLREADDIFSKALFLYKDRIVLPEYRQQFEKFCDYSYVEVQLNNSVMLEFIYQNKDEDWLKLRILKFKTYTDQSRETLWIFSNLDKQSTVTADSRKLPE